MGKLKPIQGEGKPACCDRPVQTALPTPARPTWGWKVVMMNCAASRSRLASRASMAATVVLFHWEQEGRRGGDQWMGASDRRGKPQASQKGGAQLPRAVPSIPLLQSLPTALTGTAGPVQ